MEGPQFLKKKYNLHNTQEVARASKRTLVRTGEKISGSPVAQIENYLKRFKEITHQKDLGRRKQSLDALKRILHEKYIIVPENIPESYFELQKRIARERGQGDIEITSEIRQEAVKVIQTDQRVSFDMWIDYLTSSDATYPDWAKYWAFRSMVGMSSYDKEKHEFGKRSKDTTAPFPDLNREALAYVVDVIQKKLTKQSINNPVQAGINQFAEEGKLVSDEEFGKLLDTENFAKYYAFAIEHVIADNKELFKITDGEWRVFKKGTSGYELAKTLQGHGTGWCTAGESTANAQLEMGDFHAYYSLNSLGEPTIPRLAIRMEEEYIAEVRGVAHDQEIDPYIAPILEVKMSEFGEKGEMYRKKATDMRRLTEIDNKLKNKEQLRKDELRFLWEIDSKIEGFSYAYGKDPRIEKLQTSRNKEADLIEIFTDEGKEYQTIHFSNKTSAELRIVARSPEEINYYTRLYLGDLIITPDLSIESIEHISGEITLETGGSFDQVTAETLIRIGHTELLLRDLGKFSKLSENIVPALFKCLSFYKYDTHPESYHYFFSNLNSLDVSAQKLITNKIVSSLNTSELYNLCLTLSRSYAGIPEQVKQACFERQYFDFIEFLKNLNVSDAQKIMIADKNNVNLVLEYIHNFKTEDHAQIARLITSMGAELNLEDCNTTSFGNGHATFKGGLRGIKNLDFDLARLFIEKGAANKILLRNFRTEDYSKIAVLKLATSDEIPSLLQYELVAAPILKGHFLDESVIDALLKKGFRGVRLIIEANTAFSFKEEEIADKIIDAGYILTLFENLNNFKRISTDTAFLMETANIFINSSSKSFPGGYYKKLLDAGLKQVVSENLSRFEIDGSFTIRRALERLEDHIQN